MGSAAFFNRLSALGFRRSPYGLQGEAVRGAKAPAFLRQRGEALRTSLDKAPYLRSEATRQHRKWCATRQGPYVAEMFQVSVDQDYPYRNLIALLYFIAGSVYTRRNERTAAEA